MPWPRNAIYDFVVSLGQPVCHCSFEHKCYDSHRASRLYANTLKKKEKDQQSMASDTHTRTLNVEKTK